jgi:hypothetical protein
MLIGTRQGSGRYKNELLALGAEQTEFVQSLPVPIAMWRGNKGAVLTSPSRKELAGRRVTVLICHEQLLAVSLLRVLVERPTILIGAANDHWVADTPIPRWRESALSSIARLANTPIISATNR